MTEESSRDDLGPMIMAMKGNPQHWNRVVAFNFARFLKCPLIDTHDIHQALQKSSSFSDNDITGESPALDVTRGVASTQLSLRIPVIINGPNPLPPESTLGSLWGPLAASYGARLVVVECHPPEEQPQREDYDVVAKDDDGISLVHVDADSFDGKKAEGIVSKLLRQQKYNPPTTKTTTTNKVAAAKEKGGGKQRRNDHLHQWVEKPPKDDINSVSCIACDSNDDDIIWFPKFYYKCTDCDFALHRYCAERPNDPVDRVANRCPPYLQAVRPQYDFPSKVKCKNCRGEEELEFSAVDDCHDCLMQTNLNHNFLPTVLMNDYVHDHRLSLVIVPFGYNYKYLCGHCDKIGYSVGYKCYECNDLPNFHVACALLSPPRAPIPPPRPIYLSDVPPPPPLNFGPRIIPPPPFPPRPTSLSDIILSPPPRAPIPPPLRRPIYFSDIPIPPPSLNFGLRIIPPPSSSPPPPTSLSDIILSPSPPRPIRPYTISIEKSEKLLGSDGDEELV